MAVYLNKEGNRLASSVAQESHVLASSAGHFFARSILNFP
jgi:hypothetical protein